MNQGRLIFRQLMSGEWIPFINGIPLHSTTNPFESEKIFVSQFSDDIRKNKNILVFGMGIGFHLDAIREIASSCNHSKNICVIEPNKTLIDKYEKFSKNNRPYTFYSENPEDLFYKDDFINFLLLSPLVIVHPQSIAAHKHFFDGLNAYRPPQFFEKEFFKFKNNFQQKKSTTHTLSKDQEYLLALTLQEIKNDQNGENLL